MITLRATRCAVYTPAPTLPSCAPSGQENSEKSALRPAESRIEEIEKDIRALTEDERRDLLRALIDELDSPADPHVEKAWLAAAQRRYRELVEKRVPGVPGPLMFNRLRSRLSR